jgi:hypothetical protein
VPYPREYLALPPDEQLLARAAAATHGLVRPTAAQLLDAGAERVRARRELWAWALYLAAALLVVDVALRRVRMLGYRRLAL